MEAEKLTFDKWLEAKVNWPKYTTSVPIMKEDSIMIGQGTTELLRQLLAN